LAAAVAVRVTIVPGSKVALQVVPQLIPAGVLVTVPVPLPPRLTLNTGSVPKFAITCWLAVSVTVQVLLTALALQAPPHPMKYEFATAVSVSVT